MKIKQTLQSISVLSSLLITAQVNAAELDIKLLNLTHSISFTPVLVAAHDQQISLFHLGETATTALQKMAKGGDIQFIPEPVNVVELAYDVIQRLRYQADKQRVELSIKVDSQHGIIAYADISKLERILVNLIDNAIRHTQASGAVKLEINDYQDKVQMSIIDNGKGIQHDELEAIFQPKYRASNTEGSLTNAGLGLSIVKRLLEMHHSIITVSSQPGIGSQFRFELAKKETT